MSEASDTSPPERCHHIQTGEAAASRRLSERATVSSVRLKDRHGKEADLPGTTLRELAEGFDFDEDKLGGSKNSVKRERSHSVPASNGSGRRYTICIGRPSLSSPGQGGSLCRSSPPVAQAVIARSGLRHPSPEQGFSVIRHVRGTSRGGEDRYLNRGSNF